jgi:hypothetical protein
VVLKINEQEINALLECVASKRYVYAIKRIVDQEKAWSLYKDHWALFENQEREVLFPLWPAKEYASLCARNIWKDYKTKSINLYELIEEILPHLKKNNIKLSIFNTPLAKGTTIEVDKLINDLNEELENYS